jgi:hypothetical protein
MEDSVRIFTETVVLTPHQIMHALEKAGVVQDAALLRRGKLRVVGMLVPKVCSEVKSYDLGETLVEFNGADVNAVLVIELTKVLDEENHPVEKGMEAPKETT